MKVWGSGKWWEVADTHPIRRYIARIDHVLYIYKYKKKAHICHIHIHPLVGVTKPTFYQSHSERANSWVKSLKA